VHTSMLHDHPLAHDHAKANIRTTRGYLEYG
jgi:hypothetical protein